MANLEFEVKVLGYKVAVAQMRFEKPAPGEVDSEFTWDEWDWEGFLYRREPVLPAEKLKPDLTRHHRFYFTIRENDPRIVVYPTLEAARAEVDRLSELATQRVQDEDGSLQLVPELYEGLRMHEGSDHTEDVRYKFFVEPVVEIGRPYEREITRVYERWAPWPDDDEE